LDDAELRAEIAKLNEAASRLSYSSSATAATFRQVGKSLGLADETITNSVHGIRQIGSGVTSFTRALTSSEQSFSKYSSTVDQVTSGLTGIFGGFGPLSTALEKLGDVTTALVGAVFKQNDAYISAYDNLSKFGLAGAKTADDLYELTLGTGYTSDKLGELVDITTGLGTNLTSLGRTAGEGQLAFIDMTKITKEQRAELIRLGYSFKDITVNQADYIKLLGKMGKIKAKSDSDLRTESLKYSKELTELSALTGQSIDQLKEGQQRDLNDYRYNVFMQQEREKSEKGLGGRFEEYRDAVSKIGADFGDEARTGFREILSTNIAQGDQAVALVRLTGGDIITWTKQYKEGKITIEELESKLGQAQKNAVNTMGETMTRNKEFADSMLQSAQMQQGAGKEKNAQIAASVKRQQEEEAKPKAGGLKETQIAKMEAEMQVMSAFDALVKIVADYVNPAFTYLMKGLDQFTEGLLKKFSDWGVIPADFPHMFKSASDLSSALSNKQRELSQLQSDINDPKKVKERAGADSPIARGEVAQAVAMPELEKIKMQAKIRNLQRDIETMSKILREKFKVQPPATQTVPHSGGGDFSQMTKMFSENQKNIIDPKGFADISKTFMPPVDNTGIMKILEKLLNVFKGEKENPFTQKEKSKEQKDFGISTGPLTGYESKMSEDLQAVVPLPNGQSIPVSFNNLPKEFTSKKENPLLETENLSELLNKYATSIVNKTTVNNNVNVNQQSEDISGILNLLSSKMDNLLGNLTTNNNLQNDLLTYMRR